MLSAVKLFKSVSHGDWLGFSTVQIKVDSLVDFHLKFLIKIVFFSCQDQNKQGWLVELQIVEYFLTQSL